VVFIPSSIRQRRVFLDSGAYIGVADRSDQHHNEATAILGRVFRDRHPLFTTNAVVIESHALILSRVGIEAAMQFLRSMDGGYSTVVRCRASDEARAKEIIFQYDDKDFSFTDALSFAVMERLGISQAFAFDRHFTQYGFSGLT
jgi:uncharacterized protein